MSSLYAFPGNGVASCSSRSLSSAQGTGATPASDEPRLGLVARRRHADERERPAPAVHRLEVRGGERPTSSSRISSPSASVVVSGRRRSAAGRARRAGARAGRCARSRRARGAPRRGRRDARRRRSSFAKIACSRCSPFPREAAVAAVQVARKLQAPVPAARRLEEVAADRAHRAQLRRGRERAGLAQRRRDLRVGLELGERRPGTDPAVLGSRVGTSPSTWTSVSRSDDPVPEQRDEVGAAGERDRAVAEAAAAASTELRPQELQPAPASRSRASRSARSISSRLIGSERTSAPVASRIAFAIAAAVGMIGGSPSPFEPRFVRCASGTSINSVTISGTSAIVGMPVGVERLGEDGAAATGRASRCSESVCPSAWMIPPSTWLDAPSGLITRPTSWIAAIRSTAPRPSRRRRRPPRPGRRR